MPPINVKFTVNTYCLIKAILIIHLRAIMASDEEKSTMHETDMTVASVIYNPVTFIITILIFMILYKIYRKKYTNTVEEPALPKIRKDMTASEMKQYDGNQPDGRVLVAVNGWIFDVTRGKRFYGPGGPYAAFGGKDATRGLATFSVMSSDKEHDDLSDLNSMQMESVIEWEQQFREKYDLVGRLLKPGEEPTTYSDEETEDTDHSTDKKTK